MEMVHQHSYSNNFYSSYGNFNHQNEKSAFHHHPSSNYSNNNRIFKSNKNLDPNFSFSNLIKPNFNRNDQPSNQQEVDRNDFIEFKAGMQDVPMWLKSLRLHKYKLIFSELTYEEMLALTEQQLEEKNVTKGARHKIIVNIDKLRARQSNVLSMEKSVEHEGISGIRQCLNELKSMLITPIKAFEPENECKDTSNNQEVAEGDLPSQIMKLLEKIFSLLQSESMRDDEVLNLYLSNCDKVLGHEAFTAFHKQRLLKIKFKLEPFRYSNNMKNGLDGKPNKMKWNVNSNMSTMPLNHLQNMNHFKSNNTSNNSSLNSNYHNGNGFNQNGFNNQYNSNGSLNSSQYFHPYQNISKFNSSSNNNSSNYSSQSQPPPPPQQPQNFFNKTNQMNKQNNPLNLVSSNHLQNSNQFNSNNNNQKMNFGLNKMSEPHKFNVNAECFTSSKSKPMVDINNKNNAQSNGLNGKMSNENNRKLSGNRFMLGGDSLSRFSEVFDEYDKQTNSSQKNDLNGSAKIVAPLSSCTLFNACSQIGKFNKLNSQLNSFDKPNGLDSNCIRPSNQFIFGNLFGDSTLMKCLESNSSLVNSNVFSHEKLESNYETDDFDDKDLLDENHQIYNHIELLSLRMTEQALGSSDFS